MHLYLQVNFSYITAILKSVYFTDLSLLIIKTVTMQMVTLKKFKILHMLTFLPHYEHIYYY